MAAGSYPAATTNPTSQHREVNRVTAENTEATDVEETEAAEPEQRDAETDEAAHAEDED